MGMTTMNNNWRRLFRLFFPVLFLVASLPAPSQTTISEDQQALWKLEHSYWNLVQNNDLPAYLNLWHKDFLGWPSVSAAPVHKDHITNWITDQTSKGLTFKTIEFKPAEIEVHGDVAVTYYRITFQWLDKRGQGPTHTLRVTHTLLRDGTTWHIIGGMSMPEDAGPQKMN
jgi:ketosteroid isomerase-like protein